MERKLGIIASCLPGVTEINAVEKIRNAGFNMIFSGSYDRKTVYDLKTKSDKLGLSLDFLHAPFRGINDFWVPGLAYRELRNGIYGSIDAASGADVPVVVCHVSSGWFPPQLCDIGFGRFDEMVDYAITKNVRIAFENLRKVGNLAAIMERYENIPEVGFCYDCGHEHCYTETVHFLELYASRMICTHIHDNHGRDHNDYFGDPDEHLMPFDGNLDYNDMMRRIEETGYTGALTLELGKKGIYTEKSDEEFLGIAYERIKRISKLREE